MAKNNKDNKRGLGRGLDSLIPKIDESEEEKSNKSSLTLEDILSNSEEEENENIETEKTEEEKTEPEKNEDESDITDNDVIEEIKEIEEEVGRKEGDVDVITEELITEKSIEDTLEREKSEEKEDLKEIEEPEEIEESEKTEEIVLNDYELDSIEEVKKIIEKNPRITLWSAKSSAVFRYLRKTRPEFSISKEASELIDQAVSKKYPEIWKLFEDL
ncbi:AAA family ATPase [Methanobrevibacter sp. TMH8]|uniref:AAA family ATPase n=1 Tax=Methanobrevibacter sp. TMH8 TaxID=2848611 RepID=UPI001CC9BF9C|nr:AAA family ATPase [Methanobrevibacter sp. TMH8]MBZ9570485.1 AAA family ATPase [Methanobrevibacter sp. TMH8]